LLESTVPRLGIVSALRGHRSRSLRLGGDPLLRFEIAAQPLLPSLRGLCPTVGSPGGRIGPTGLLVRSVAQLLRGLRPFGGVDGVLLGQLALTISGPDGLGRGLDLIVPVPPGGSGGGDRVVAFDHQQPQLLG
jgi:hypothetical protein